MKVLIVSAFPPDPAPEANHGLHISEHLADAGLTVHVLCKQGSIAATRQNIIVHPLIKDWTWSDLPIVAKCLRQCDPDVILILYIGWVYNYRPMVTFLPSIVRVILPTVPCITQLETIDQSLPPRSFLANVIRRAMTGAVGGDMRWLFGTLLRDSAHIMVLSSPHKARLLNHYPELEEKCTILPPPPLIRVSQEEPATVRRQVRQEIAAEHDDFVVTYWGYIYPGKGVETLLRAFNLASKDRTNMRLLLVGGSLDVPTWPMSSSDYFKRVRHLPKKLGIEDKVTWTGHFNWDSDTGSRYLFAGDVCVLPFDYGLTLNNSSLAAASVHGLPIIGTELPAGRDEALQHGRNIYLLPARDPGNLADAIRATSESGPMRKRLREGALQLASDWYDWRNTTRRLIGVLESAVSTKAVRSPKARDQIVEDNLTCERSSPAARCRSDMFTKSAANDLRSAGDELLARSQKDHDIPLVSVIVAAYNVETYLSQCLESLVNQTLKNIEIIVVNDASTDKSGQIIDFYRQHANLRVINCEYNRGLATVRNIGLRSAKGRYVAFTDGDDWADVRMCEALYQRASQDDSDVVIADTHVFYDDSKAISKFFDQGIRKTFDPRLYATPFDLETEPRVLLLEPVAWTKLYKRTFLQDHKLEFEDGMNTYEDIIFHFSVLLKAERISLLDDSLWFYRQNRLGQISGRTNRKIFEVFSIFDRIQANLRAWDASADIWALLTMVQIRQFDWLLRDRVQPRDKRAFLALVASQFATVPRKALQKAVREANADEIMKLFCMRRNWLRAYESLVQRRWPLFPLLYLILARGGRRQALRKLIQQLSAYCEHFFSWSSPSSSLTARLQAVEIRLQGLIERTLQSKTPLVKPYRISNQSFFFSYPFNEGVVSDAISRMEYDHYLTQMAIFREGDVVVDVGAQLGVMSIYLAKKYPFINVYAIEPDPLNYACLKQNIEANGVRNVIAVNKALSGDGKKRTLFVSVRDAGWATIDADVASASEHPLRTAEVETFTLDQLFEEYGIHHCRLLKMVSLGTIHESLKAFTKTGCVDFLCGEADLYHNSRVELEVASWRIARQHFWRLRTPPNGSIDAWIYQPPITLGDSKVYAMDHPHQVANGPMVAALRDGNGKGDRVLT